MSDLVPGDLVEVLHPGFSEPPLALVIELSGGTHLYRVLMNDEGSNKIFRGPGGLVRGPAGEVLMNDEGSNKIFRYSSSILRKVS